MRNKIFICATILLLLTSALVYFHDQTRHRGLESLTRRQQAATFQAASQFTDHLIRLQEELRQLAQSAPDLLHSRRDPLQRLEMLFHTFPASALLTTFIKDSSGNIIAEYPQNTLAQSGFPVHLLGTPLQGASSSEVISLEGKPLLRISQAVPMGSEKQGELSALIRLDHLQDHCLGPAGKEDGYLFLLDENGRFVLHGEEQWNGCLFRELGFLDSHPAFNSFLSSVTRGDYSHPGYFGAVPLPKGEKALVTCTPLTLPGTQWTLGLVSPFPSEAGDHQGFIIVLAGLLLFSSLLALPAGRFVSRSRRIDTKRQELEAEILQLRRSLDRVEKRAEHLLDHAGDAFFFIDPATGSLLEVNRRAEELLGYKAEEIRTLSLGILFPGREFRRYLRLVKNVLREGYGEERHLTFRCKDGRQFVGEVHARLGHLGDSPMVHGVVRDVSQILMIEQELRRKNRDLVLMNDIAHFAASNRNLEGLLSCVLTQILRAFSADGGGIYLCSEEHKEMILTAHQGIADEIRQEIEKMPAGEGLVGRIVASGRAKTVVNAGRDQRIWSEAARRAGWGGIQGIPLSANEKTIGVLFFFSRDRLIPNREDLALLLTLGKQLGTAIEGVRLLSALQHQVRLTQATNRDLENSRFQLRQNLAELEEANRAMAQLDQMKSHFLALASHELRTPLTYILSGTELLAATMDERLSGDERRTMEVICEGGLRLKGIVEDLLEAARIESQSLYLAREPIEPHSLLSEICSEFQTVLAERHLRIHMAPFPEALPLCGDAFHLKKTFQRLFENAIKFTPGGGRIDIMAHHRSAADLYRNVARLRQFSPTFFASTLNGAYLQVTVQDSGVGIEREDQLRIFDKFYEVGDINGHSTSRTRFGGKGVGLGLTLVKGMVEAHGGMVWVESTGAGCGSAFHVLLPLAGVRERDDAPCKSFSRYSPFGGSPEGSHTHP